MADEEKILATFEAYLESPSVARFDELREMVIKSASYEPYTDDLRDVRERISKGEFDRAKQRIVSGLPNLILSPRAHLFLALIAESGDAPDVDAESERSVARACAEAILATGEGTRERPFWVLRTSDEYDLLDHVDRQFTGKHRLVHEDSRHFDVLECQDGEVWFDITDPYNQLADSMRRRQ